jgi:hypothetical protein
MRFVAALLVALPCLAWGHDYTYLEAGLLEHEDLDYTDSIPARGSSTQGYFVTGQLAMPTRPYAYFAEYGQTDVLEHFSVGMLRRYRLTERLHATTGASVEFEDMTDEKGYGVRAGLRFVPFGPMMEIHPELRYAEMFEAQTSARLTLLVYAHQLLRAEAAAQVGDDPRLLVGLRYLLPRR